jgi:hypothetical protein
MNLHIFQTRINNELKLLYKIYTKIDINLSENVITIYELPYKYAFVVSELYPFVPPKIYYNDILYVDFLKTDFSHFNEILYDIHKLSCLCCNSLICKGIWNVSFTLHDVIVEINKYTKYKRDVIYKIYADKIKSKYLINDINLDQYLF